MAIISDRAAALARLAELGAAGAATPHEEPTVTRTGAEVYAGGDEARLLIRSANLSYRKKSGRQYVEATVGDVVLLDAAQAKRLDALGVTVAPDTDDAKVDAALSPDVTDEDLLAMHAAELVAHVGQHPDQADRIRDLELARPEENRRKTVLAATDPEKRPE